MTTQQNISSGRQERLFTPCKAFNKALPRHTVYNTGYPIMKLTENRKQSVTSEIKAIQLFQGEQARRA